MQDVLGPLIVKDKKQDEQKLKKVPAKVPRIYVIRHSTSVTSLLPGHNVM